MQPAHLYVHTVLVLYVFRMMCVSPLQHFFFLENFEIKKGKRERKTRLFVFHIDVARHKAMVRCCNGGPRGGEITSLCPRAEK